MPYQGREFIGESTVKTSTQQGMPSEGAVGSIVVESFGGWRRGGEQSWTHVDDYVSFINKPEPRRTVLGSTWVLPHSK